MRACAQLGIACLTAVLGACQQKIEEMPVAWKYTATAPGAAAPLVTVNYVAMPTDAGVQLVGLAGEPRCFFDAHGAVRATPRSDGRMLFVSSTSGIVYAIDGQCNVVWKHVTGEGVEGDSALSGGTLFVPGYEGHVFALNAETGVLNWTFPSDGQAGGSGTPSSTTPQAGAPAGSDPTEPAAAPQAEHPAKGKGKKAKAKRQKSKSKGKGKKGKESKEAHNAPTVPTAPVPPPPASHVSMHLVTSGVSVADGVVYFAGKDHNLYALNAADGGLRWKYETDGLVTATPWVADGLVYVGSQDGNLYAIRAGDHTLAWKFATQDRLTAPVRIINRVLYVGSHDKNLYALDPAKGTVRWKVESPGAVTAAVSAYKGLIVMVDATGEAQLVQASDAAGKVVWRNALGTAVSAAPVVVEERLYISGLDGVLRAVAVGTLPLAKE